MNYSIKNEIITHIELTGNEFDLLCDAADYSLEKRIIATNRIGGYLYKAKDKRFQNKETIVDFSISDLECAVDSLKNYNTIAATALYKNLLDVQLTVKSL